MPIAEKTSASASQASKSVDARFPEDMRDAEYQKIWVRRGVPQDQIERPPPVPPRRLGLALSGGGIRSATFCLGVLQSMARSQVLDKVDYLSTVSGGGYIGGFLGTLYARSNSGSKTVEETLSDNHSPEVSWLRENGRYLAPNGDGDVLMATAVQFRNWSSVVAVMGISALTVFLGTYVLWLLMYNVVWLRWLTGKLIVPDKGDICWWSPWFVPTLLVALLGLVFAWGFWLVGNPSHKATGARDFSKWSPLVVMCVSACLGAELSGLHSPYTWSSIHTEILQWDAAALFKFLFALGAVTAIVHFGMWLWAHQTVNSPLLGQTQTTGLAMTPGSEVIDTTRLLRNRYSDALKTCLVISGCLLVFAVIDTLGQSLYLAFRNDPRAALRAIVSSSSLALFLSLGDKLAPWIQRFSGKGNIQPSRNILALIAGFAAIFLFLLNCSILAHACAWRFAVPVKEAQPDGFFLWSAFLSGGALAYLCGKGLPFLNASSLQYLYGSRLVRAYLGASNPRRHSPKTVAVTNTIPGDDLRLSVYQPYLKTGPLHIINVTFNETCDGKSQLEQRDRKGLPFAVGPAGLSVGARYHALWAGSGDEMDTLIDPIVVGNPSGTFQMFPPVSKSSVASWMIQSVTSFWKIGPLFASLPRIQQYMKKSNTREVQSLTLGHWIAISGAAFGTGMGQNTSLGTSLLTGLANIRLGYWWDSHVAPSERKESEVDPGFTGWVGRQFSSLFPVQSYLLDEWLARFHGPARQHWYLSDGGNFENTAIYEFLRRRVPYVICCDCGADPDYNFTDMANLVRKARIDFGAEVRILSREEVRGVLSQSGHIVEDEFIRQFGGPEQFDAGRQDGHQPHAVLAAVCFTAANLKNNEYALILFLKPALSGDEPLDLWEYHIERADFPQEPTTEQFFDEAQWESYRKLGEHTASVVLGSDRTKQFWFTALNPATIWGLLESSDKAENKS